MSKGTTRRSIRIDDELWKEAHMKSAQQGENLSDVIRKALRSYIESTMTRQSFEEEVARNAAEFKQELADAYAEALPRDRRK